MPPSPEAVIGRYQAMYGRLRTGTARQAEELWLRYGGPSDADVERFLSRVLPLIAGAEVAAVRLLAGYMATMTRAAAGEAVEATVDADAITGTALRGVDPASVYARPVVTLRVALANGKPLAEAMRQSADRVGVIAQTDIALTQRAATTEIARADNRIVGYRRVLTGLSCALCATASTQRYRNEDLMPIHGRCDCGVAPIIGGSDPGRTINKQLVRDLRAASGDKQYATNRHLTVDANGNVHLPDTTVHQHGELGPVLSAKEHAFTGPGDLAA